MYFDNHLTEDDMQRVDDICPNPPPALLMAGSFAALLEAIDTYTQETVHPVTSGMLGLTDREKVILGLYYRSVGFCRTAIELKSVIHQQSLTSAERSVIELYVDMELVHRDAIPDAVERVIAFSDWQKLKAARRKRRVLYEESLSGQDAVEGDGPSRLHRQRRTTHRGAGRKAMGTQG